MTGLQWAVLTAYARSLPRSSEARQLIEAATKGATPSAIGQRVALTLAEQSGMTHSGGITAKGKTAARAFLPRLIVIEAKTRAPIPPPSIDGPQGGAGGDT